MVRSMFDAIAPRYDLVNRLMTFGLDLRWRRRSVRALGLPARSRVLDLACGTGDFLRILDACRAAPGGHGPVVGDAGSSPHRPPPGPGRRRRPARGRRLGGRCHLRLRPAQLHRARPGVRRAGRVVRPGRPHQPAGGGRARERPCCAAGHRIWFRTVVPVIGGLLSDRAAYRYLPRSTAYLPPTAELRSMLVAAGFSTVNHRALSGGLSQLITATRAGRP